MSGELLTRMYLPCGGTAVFDWPSGMGYRCEFCGAMLGSIGQPKRCREAEERYRVLQQLGSQVKWDYDLGCEVSGESK